VYKSGLVRRWILPCSCREESDSGLLVDSDEYSAPTICNSCGESLYICNSVISVLQVPELPIILVSWGGMKLSPLGTSGTNWSIVQVPDDS
jgi:hypothetical protein